MATGVAVWCRPVAARRTIGGRSDRRGQDMGRLAWRLAVLFLVFSTSMSFITLGVYSLTWYWSVVGVGILVVFAALGGLLVPSAQRMLPERQKKAASSLLQVFGALLATEFLTMALITWIKGNQTLAHNNWYQVLGLLIFLALLGAGAQGVVLTIARFSYAWSHRDADADAAA